MNRYFFIISGLLILGLINYSIWQKEVIINQGETIFVELAPVDPRSLMQGDYMRLAFNLERKIDKSIAKAAPLKGYIIIEKDENQTAKFIGLYSGAPLTTGQKLLRYSKNNRRITSIEIKPRSFFFQEGHRKQYQRAKYGVYKFNGPKDYLLVALANENRKIINSPKDTSPQKP